jgi:type IV pilus assembly protein PilQ
MKYLKIINLFVWLLFSASLFGQETEDRFTKLMQQLEVVAADSPGLEETVDLSVSAVPLKEFLRALGNTNKVNISVDNTVEGQVVNNFNNVSVAEVLVFLAKQYKLDFDITGNIIHVVPFEEIVPEVVKPVRIIPFAYDTASTMMTIELKNDSIPKVAKLLTQRTAKNVVYQPGLENTTLSVYLEDVEFDQAMDKIAFANNLKISKTQDDFYMIEKAQNNKGAERNNRLKDLGSTGTGNALFSIDSGLVSLEAENQPLGVIVRDLFQNLGVDYFLYANLEGNVTMKIYDQPLENFLQKLFYGTNYTYRIYDGLFVIGEREVEGLRETRRIYLQHRSVDKIIEFIPDNIKTGVSIKEFTELNSLLVSGSYPQILELEAFIKEIDQSVPVVIIEVLIVDYQRNNNVTVGVEAGLGTEPAVSGGSIYPSFNYNLNANSINNLLNSFKGFGALNLGPVTPNFYMNLQFLEDNGVLNVKSTPKLSTLNGHEANISIGNTEYYVVEQNTLQGIQNPIPQITRNYQSVEANFTLKIKPIVSGDSSVTLEIDVEQSDFTARIDPQAPPGSVNRKFTSMIRVKNEEMVILGGLEEKSVEDSGSGIPLLSRIPILKYLFSSRTNNIQKTKLNIFIKPTVIN